MLSKTIQKTSIRMFIADILWRYKKAIENDSIKDKIYLNGLFKGFVSGLAENNVSTEYAIIIEHFNNYVNHMEFDYTLAKL